MADRDKTGGETSRPKMANHRHVVGNITNLSGVLAEQCSVYREVRLGQLAADKASKLIYILGQIRATLDSLREQRVAEDTAAVRAKAQAFEQFYQEHGPMRSPSRPPDASIQ